MPVRKPLVADNAALYLEKKADNLADGGLDILGGWGILDAIE